MPEDPLLEPSILKSIKKTLNMPEDYTEYDMDVVLFINGALNVASDLGIGPDEGFRITGYDETWDQFTGADPLYDEVKSLIFMKAKLIFDPPPSGYGITSMEKMIEQAEVRLNMRRENKEWTDPVTGERATPPGGADGGTPTPPDETVLDGGSPTSEGVVFDGGTV